METQLDMNICWGDAYSIADSILNQAYSNLIGQLNTVYQRESKSLDKDKIQLDYLEDLKGQIEAVIASESDFKQLRESMTQIISLQYKGGSMEPMASSMYALKLTVNQLKAIIKLTNELIY